MITTLQLAFFAQSLLRYRLPGILTPQDEFRYWSEVALSGGKLDAKERAQHFEELFQPMARDFGTLDGMEIGDLLELVEVCQDTLDDLWKQSDVNPPYPEARMRHLLEVVG